jgi:hypothetical protein
MKSKLKGLKDLLRNDPVSIHFHTSQYCCSYLVKDEHARFSVEGDGLGLKELVPGCDPVVEWVFFLLFPDRAQGTRSQSIVAVHGLNGHREKSWMDDESGILWLRDLLPYRFPNARILTFGYEANPLNLSDVSHLTLNDHGISLIVELLRFRRNSEVSQPIPHWQQDHQTSIFLDGQMERRPIIFLAHSLGGIVVKHVCELCRSSISANTCSKALVTCDSARRGHNEEYRSIKVSTYGIVFFGTPHACATSGEFQKILNNIGRIFISGNSTVLQLLRRDSEYLRYLTELYSPISSHFRTIVFYEEFNTPLSKGASLMVRYFRFFITAFLILSYRLFQRYQQLFQEQMMLLLLHLTKTTLTW